MDAADFSRSAQADGVQTFAPELHLSTAVVKSAAIVPDALATDVESGAPAAASSDASPPLGAVSGLTHVDVEAQGEEEAVCEVCTMTVPGSLHACRAC